MQNFNSAIATLTINPPSNSLNSSTFDSGSFTITNDSTNGQEIERVVIDISSAILKDLVFDIDGQAGDPLGKGFTVNNEGNTGQTSFNYLTPFNNGFTGLEILFNDFQPGETLSFSIDVDPSSIQGLPFSGPGLSGKISGLELVGSTVTVDFDDDTTAVGKPFYVSGTNDASTAVIQADLPKPNLEILNLSSETTTANPNQTVRISGTPGSEVSLLIVEGALFTDNGNGFDLDPFEANSAIAIREENATIGTQGYVDLAIILTRTEVNSGEAGLNILTAVTKDSNGITSLSSDIVTVEYDPQFVSGLFGGSGNDTIDGTTNANVLDGGAGRDLLDYRNSQAGVNVDLATNTADGGDATGDTISNFENLFGSINGDRLAGDSQSNILWGFGGNDTINGSAGNDTINGGVGADILDGGEGQDLLNYSTSAEKVIVDLATNTADGGDATGDTISNFENLFGSTQGDRLTGDSQDNIILGFSGNDTIDGGAGSDTLNGGAGRDLLNYRNSQAGVNVDLATNTADGGDATGDTISNFENLFGSINGDRLAGDSQSNILWGFGGNDTINGSAGNDTINGGVGADILDGGEGQDLLNYSTSAEGVIVDLATNTADGGDATGDTISSFENLFGSTQGDRLTGDSQDNIILGFSGNDTLSGGMGKDLLVGGAGNDTFAFASFQESLLASFDVIADFDVAADAINVPMIIDSIDSFGTVNSLSAADVSSSLSALGSNHAATLQFDSRAFVAINDSNSGFDVSQDLLLEITGYTGNLNDLAIV